MRRFRRLETKQERRWASHRLQAWDYYRELYPYELQVSHWFRWGHDLILWFNPANEDATWLAVHICARPEARKTWGGLGRRLMEGMEILAETLDARRICAILSEDQAIIRDYLERWAWTHDPETGWMVKELEEGT